MKRNEQLLNAMSDIGDDLILESERPMPNPWRTALSLAACAAILVGMGAALGQYLRTPVQIDPALPPAAEQMGTPAPLEQPPALTQPVIQTPVPPVQPGEEPVQPETPEVPQAPIPLPEPQPVYVFQTDSRAVAVDEEGKVVLEAPGASMELVEDQRTGEAAALLVLEKDVTDLYTLDGRYVTRLPGSMVQVFDELLWCGGLEAELPKVYDRRTGQRLYDNVHYFEPLGAHFLLITETQALLVTGENRIVTELQWPETSYHGAHAPYLGAIADGKETVLDETGRSILDGWYDSVEAVVDTEAGRYFLVREENRCGAVDETGRICLPLVYDQLRHAEGELVYGRSEGDYVLLELSTGETVFQWPGEFTVAGDRLIASVPEEGGEILLDLSGNRLTDRVYDSIRVLARTRAGAPGLFLGTDWNGGTEAAITCFAPSGIILWQRYSNYQWQLEEDVLLFSERDSVTLLDPWTGTIRYAVQEAGIRGEALEYDRDGHLIPTGSFIVVTRTDEHGAEEASVVHGSGRTVLEGCRELVYRGGGVVQCTQNGISGLLRLDGTWLYQAPMK